jgi:hypothetical protein
VFTIGADLTVATNAHFNSSGFPVRPPFVVLRLPVGGPLNACARAVGGLR